MSEETLVQQLRDALFHAQYRTHPWSAGCSACARGNDLEVRLRDGALADRDALIARLRKALTKAREYVQAVHAQVAGAMGHERTVVAPDLAQVDAALALTPETAGAELAALRKVAEAAEARHKGEQNPLGFALAKWRATREKP